MLRPILDKKPSIAREDVLQPIAVPVAVLTFKVIQSQWFCVI